VGHARQENNAHCHWVGQHKAIVDALMEVNAIHTAI
jgi:capsid protein